MSENIKEIDYIRFKRIDIELTTNEKESILKEISLKKFKECVKYEAPVELWYMKDGTIECASIGILPSKRIRESMADHFETLYCHYQNRGKSNKWSSQKE